MGLLFKSQRHVPTQIIRTPPPSQVRCVTRLNVVPNMADRSDEPRLFSDQRTVFYFQINERHFIFGLTNLRNKAPHFITVSFREN